MSGEKLERASPTKEPELEIREQKEAQKSSETAVAEPLQPAATSSEQIVADIQATDKKIDAERTGLNNVRAELGLPPSDTSAAIKSLQSRRREFQQEYVSQPANLQETAPAEATGRSQEPLEQKPFERPADDPAIQEVLRTIDEQTGREYGQYARGQWGKIAQEGALRGTGGSSRNLIEWRIGNRNWDSFLFTHPDIAERYREHLPDIDKAFQRKSQRERQEQIRPANKQESTSRQSENAAEN